MEVLKQLLIEYGPTILAAIMSAVVAFIGKKLSENGNALENSVKNSIGLLEAKNDVRIEQMEQALQTMALENAELKKKLNRTIELLGKVEVKEDSKDSKGEVVL